MWALALPGVFWTAVVVVLHTYAIYPLLLILLDAVEQARSTWRYIGGTERRRPAAQLGLPHVSVLVAAYNEASCIGQRIENLLAQDYPSDKIEIIVGSDASIDGTDAVVQHYAARGAPRPAERLRGPVRTRGGRPRGGRSGPLRRIPSPGEDRGRRFPRAGAVPRPALSPARIHLLRAVVAQGAALVRARGAGARARRERSACAAQPV